MLEGVRALMRECWRSGRVRGSFHPVSMIALRHDHPLAVPSARSRALSNGCSSAVAVAHARSCPPSEALGILTSIWTTFSGFT